MVAFYQSGGDKGAEMKRIAMSGVLLVIAGLAFAAYPGDFVQAVAITEQFTVPEAGALFLFGSGLTALVSYRRIHRMRN